MRDQVSAPVDDRPEEKQADEDERADVEPFPAVAQDHDQPVELARPVEPVGGDAGRLAPPQQHQRHRRHQRQAVQPGAEARGEELAAEIVLADQLGRKAEHAERPPAERMDDPQGQRDRHEQGRAQPDMAQPPQPQPQGEGVQRQPHRQREIHESEQKRKIERERHREQGGGGNAAVHFVGNPDQPGDGQRRDRHHDQLHRGLEADQRREQLDQQVDAEIADHLPMEAEILLEVGRGGEIELDPVAAHMAGQVEQRRHVGPEQRQRREEDERQHEIPPLPKGPRLILVASPEKCLLHRLSPLAPWRTALPSPDGRGFQLKKRLGRDSSW